MDLNCPICGTGEKKPSIGPYFKCSGCDHEFQFEVKDSYIINDQLSLNEIKKVGSLDRFKNKILRLCTADNNFLLDVGCASGKFLVANKDKFKNYLGLEVTKECLDFCREKLNLHVTSNVSEIEGINLSVVTFWHSLEHIPAAQTKTLLEIISRNADKNIRIIVSVPNASSLAYRFFKDKFAYFDSSSHYHQFSNGSLDDLFGVHGFVRCQFFTSFAYALFGYLQSFLNLLNPIHNFLYFSLKRKQKFPVSRFDFFCLFSYNIGQIIIFLPVSLILTIYDYIYKKGASVLTVCYKKIP